jgi:hypothetical protein
MAQEIKYFDRPLHTKNSEDQNIWPKSDRVQEKFRIMRFIYNDKIRD